MSAPASRLPRVTVRPARVQWRRGDVRRPRDRIRPRERVAGGAPRRPREYRPDKTQTPAITNTQRSDLSVLGPRCNSAPRSKQPRHRRAPIGVTQAARWRSSCGCSPANEQVGASRIRANVPRGLAGYQHVAGSTKTAAQPRQTGHPLSPSRDPGELLARLGRSASMRAAAGPCAIGLPLTSADQPSSGRLTGRSQCRFRRRMQPRTGLRRAEL